MTSCFTDASAYQYGFPRAFFENKEQLNLRPSNEEESEGVYFLSFKPEKTFDYAYDVAPISDQIRDLREISRFVNSKLEEHIEELKELELGEKDSFTANLVHLDNLIHRHNKKIEEDICLSIISILLLILTFGIFDFTDHLLAERLKIRLLDNMDRPRIKTPVEE